MTSALTTLKMKKEIKEFKTIDGKDIVRITTSDERWYCKPIENRETGLPEYQYVPSVTWISGHYPKGIGFYKWLANKGWDESEAIKEAAGDKGSKVHQAIEKLINGGAIKMEDRVLNPSTGELEEIEVAEYECLMSFTEWFKEAKPEVIANEITAFNDKIGYAGTIDMICRIDGKIYIIDFKTAQTVWPEHEIQLSAYSQLELRLEELKIKPEEWANRSLAILQIGYRRNKNGWKFTETDNKFELFKAAKQIWQNECGEMKPSQKDYPLVLSMEDIEPEEKVEKKINKGRSKK